MFIEEEFTTKLLGIKDHLFTSFDVTHGLITLVGPDNKPIPKHMRMFREGETVVIRNCTFKVAYTNEATLVLEPLSLPVIGTWYWSEERRE